MTTQDHSEWTEKLSDYLDGELPDQEQRAVAAHVADCAACARTLEELREIARRAAALAPREPAADLWRGIAERISAESTEQRTAGFASSRRFSFTWMELAAASVLLVVVTGFTVMRLTSRADSSDSSAGARLSRPATDAATGVGQTRSDTDAQLRPVSFDDTEYDAAVADLQRALESGRGQLDPATVRIVEDNLSIIDQAVDDARRALAEDPGNADLSGYLLDTRRRKLDLLRHAAALSEDFN
jgi:anti-sigma factor RsiW